MTNLNDDGMTRVQFAISMGVDGASVIARQLFTHTGLDPDVDGYPLMGVETLLKWHYRTRKELQRVESQLEAAQAEVADLKRRLEHNG